ncbi:CDP-alcohol phosphatidyltransferase family protein [Bacterioplanoides sp. SCSIO 12839]|uniref:CDP-alcohol phosphatidyltransferase family protein n=1 Tax=Bacterioplanoides sp. SCSIO 12839 TaxID=2829569 RepID=UPI0021026FA7|nr:CDP-alcohol phosphatidyltransferase family protein [Bacterioplanoides sp. SCSIO 12839]UTW49362.1 CDP-alcohol phosphatidyltransferase family protein [Bacterioplanoides sp. SCSIO 12839]
MKNMNSPWLIRLNRVDCITLLSVPLTLLAISEVLQQHIMSALGLLYLAMTADALDGMLARRWNLTRNFGRYLDGFMDVLIYLLTPALILMQWGFTGWWMIPLVLMVGCGCIRLSVFNETGNLGEGEANKANSEEAKPEEEAKPSETSVDGLAYQGMPVFWSLFIIAPLLWLNTLGVLPTIATKVLLAVSLTVFSYLMVRKARFFKFSSLRQILALTLGGFLLWTLGSENDGLAKALLTAFYLQIPVVIGGVLHMVVVSRDYLPGLAKPIWKTAFGANKTWRGFVVVPALTAAGALVLLPFEWLLGDRSPFAGYSLLLAGAIAGLGYMLGELPNSLVKRRMGIGAGELPEQGKVITIAVDQLDSAIGVAAAYSIYLGISSDVALWYIISFPLTALIVKDWLHKNALKQSAV